MSCTADALELKMGDTWAQTFILAADDTPVSQGGDARDLTGLKVRGVIFSVENGVRTDRVTFDSDVAGDVDIEAEDGEVTFNLSSVDSAAITGVGDVSKRWTFEFELYDDSESPEYVETILTRAIVVSPD